MRYNKKFYILPFIILLIIICLINAYKINQINKNKQNDIYKSKTGFFMGTIVTIKIWGSNVNDQIFEQIFDKINDIESKMSINIKDSEVSKINKNAGSGNFIPISSETFSVIDKGIFYSNLSNGHFDISIGSLVKLWGIGTKKASIPSQENINKAKNLINYKNIILNKKNNMVKLKNKGMMIDLGGIAKGYTADMIAKMLIEKGYHSAIINLGGNIYTLGRKPNKDLWIIAIQNPFSPRGTYLGKIRVNNKSVVTSGIYERYFIKNGKKYHHILNPFTGYPVENNLASVSIISDKSIDGDALSTSVFSLGLNKGMELINSLQNTEAIFVTKDKKVYISDGLKDIFEITDDSFSLQ